MIVGIDGDLLVYRTAFSVERKVLVNNEPEVVVGSFNSVVARLRKLIRKIEEATYSTSSIIYLSGDNQYRKNEYTEYKENRKDFPKPLYFNETQDYLINNYNAKMVNVWEADDELGILNCFDGRPSIISSLDKDLLMIPGLLYNWNTGKTVSITEQEGLLFFYRQLLIGDVIDNVKGVYGIGPVKAKKLLTPDMDEKEMCRIVLEKYDGDRETLRKNGQLLWILREPYGWWEIPDEI